MDSRGPYCLLTRKDSNIFLQKGPFSSIGQSATASIYSLRGRNTAEEIRNYGEEIPKYGTPSRWDSHVQCRYKSSLNKPRRITCTLHKLMVSRLICSDLQIGKIVLLFKPAVMNCMPADFFRLLKMQPTKVRWSCLLVPFVPYLTALFQMAPWIDTMLRDILALHSRFHEDPIIYATVSGLSFDMSRPLPL